MDDAQRRALLDSWFRQHGDRVLAYLLPRTAPIRRRRRTWFRRSSSFAFRRAADVPEPPIGWLFATARKLLANSRRGLRRGDRMLTRLAEDSGETSEPAVADRKRAFTAALATLSSRDREVLTLSGWHGLTAADGSLHRHRGMQCDGR